jgi:hypothetical protein
MQAVTDAGVAGRGGFTSTEVVYGVTGTDVTVFPEYGVAVKGGGHLAILRNG